jgi:hypothetical protein
MSQPDVDPLSATSDAHFYLPPLHNPRELHEILENTTLSPGEGSNQAYGGTFEDPWVPPHLRTDAQVAVPGADYFTPSHTEVSIAEEMFTTFPSYLNLFGDSQQAVALYAELEFFFQSQSLFTSVTGSGYKVQAPATGAQDPPINALRRALSFHLRLRRIPPADVILQNTWNSIRGAFPGPDKNLPGPETGHHLASILEQYNVQNNEQFELVIVSKAIDYEHYVVEVPIPRDLSSTRIFLFYDRANNNNAFLNRWAPIIPDHTSLSDGSYADALAAPIPPPPPPIRTNEAVNQNLLHIGYTSPDRPRQMAIRPATTASQRSHQNRRRALSQVSSRKGKRSNIGSQPPSEVGDEPSRCVQCSEVFTKKADLT